MRSTTASGIAVLALAAATTVTVGCSRIKDKDASYQDESLPAQVDAGKPDVAAGEQQGGEPKASEGGRELAGRFVGCEPAALTLINRRAYRTYDGEDRVEESYALGLPEDEEVKRISVGVDPRRGLVLRAAWSFRALESGGKHNPLSQAKAEKVARAFVQDKCPHYAPTDKVRVSTAAEGGEVQSYHFEFTGEGPGESSHWIQVRIDAIRGLVSSYGLAVLPPEPPPTSPIKVTEAKARSLALAKAEALGITIQELTIGLHTRSVFGAPGVPVYIANIDGLRNLPGESGRKVVYCEQWAVHATTGEVLTEPTHLPPGPPPPPKQ